MTRPRKDIALVAEAHVRQLALCADLEAIADDLPSQVDRQRCLHLARAVCPTIAAAQSIEEELVFPAMRALLPAMPELQQTLERLRWEHFEDMCFAEELHDALLAMGCGEPTLDAEATGYMLRGFFESLRRHVAFEREMLLPLLTSRNAI
ncbi:MAG: hemerythrin domain-containing protein [Rhizobiaceae bacterium]